MSAIRSQDALSILLNAYGKTDGRNTTPKRWDLRNEQLDMIREISDRYNESQVSVLRAIIDEWRDMKIKEGAF